MIDVSLIQSIFELNFEMNNELKIEIINFIFYSFLKNTWPRFTVSLLGDR